MRKAVLFDMDGVLVDSEPVHCVNTISALENQGIALTEQEYYDFWTRDGKNIVQFAQERGVSIDRERYRADKRAAFPELVRTHLRPMPHAREALEGLQGKYRIALVSSSGRDEIEFILAHADLGNYFELIVGYGDVRNPKPAPDQYLLAAERLAFSPVECTVIEDTWKGVEAGNAAWMRVIAVPNAQTRSNDFSKADAVIASLAELTPEIIG
jgi:beta-phosphoglucomutase